VVPKDQSLGAYLPGDAQPALELEQRIRVRERNGLAALGDPADPEVGERGAEHEPQLTRDGLRTIRPSAALLRQRMQG
jgi:hypothetical protein